MEKKERKVKSKSINHQRQQQQKKKGIFIRHGIIRIMISLMELNYLFHLDRV